MNLKQPFSSTAWPLSSFYFFYFASLAIFIPFWNPYLEKALGFSNVEIGIMTAVVLGTRTVAPVLWGWLADHSGKRIQIIRFTSLAVPIITLAVFWVETPLAMAILLAVFSIFWNAALPQVEVIAFDSLGSARKNDYTYLRLWGSVGFVLTVLLVGALVDWYSIHIILPLMIVSLLLIWLTTLTIPVTLSSESEVTSSGFVQVLKQPAVIALLVVCFFNQLTHMPYYTFFTIYLTDNGYSETQAGGLWALGVIAEILLFIALPKLWKHINAWTLLVWTTVAVIVRWSLIAWGVDVWWVMVLAQILHMLTYGGYHAAAVILIHRYFQGRSHGRGQALYSAVSFGVGGAVGALLSGPARELIGDAWMFTGAALAGVAGLIAALIGRQYDHRNDCKNSLEK